MCVCVRIPTIITRKCAAWSLFLSYFLKTAFSNANGIECAGFVLLGFGMLKRFAYIHVQL